MVKAKNSKRLGLLAVLSVILMLCMTLGILLMTTTTAYAVTTTRTTTLELSTFTGDESNAAEGWSWDHANRTLTLNSVNINVTSGYGISQKDNITDLTTVVLNGDNNITCNNEGLYCFGPLTIQGTGSLSITAADEKYYTAGIHSVGDLTIMSGTITATANSFLGSNYIYGIRAYNGDFIMHGGTVTATTGNAIGANQGTRGVSAINVKIYGGSLTTTAGTATGTETSVGVDASAGVTMTGGALIASGNTKAISNTITTTGTPTVKAGIDSSAGEITFTSPGTLADKYVNISFATIFDNGFGKTDCAFDTYTKGTKDDTIGYTFAGWFNGATELTAEANAVAGTTYTAKWTNGDKSVRFEALDLSTQTTDIANADEGWAWNATTKTLTLSGLTLDTSASSGVTLPAGSSIILTAGSVNNITAGHSAEALTSQIYGVIGYGSITIEGEGALNVKTGNSTQANYGIAASGAFTNKATSVTVTSGDGTYSRGIYTADNFINETGTITVTSGCGTYSATYGIYTGKSLTNGTGTINANGGNYKDGTNADSYGISAKNSITNNGGNINATAGKAARSYGIMCAENATDTLTNNGGTIIATSGESTGPMQPSDGIRILAGSLSNTNNGIIKATGANGPSSFGIHASNSVIASDSGLIEATSGIADPTKNYSYGIQASGVTISGGELKAQGQNTAVTCAITTSGSVKVGADADNLSAAEGTSPYTVTEKYVTINFAPTFDNGFGKTDCKFTDYTRGAKDATIGYTFAGWFNGDAELTDSASADAGRTYTAKWTNNGKAVRNEILDLSNMTENAARESEGWAWNATTKTLTLSGLTIDTTAATALKLPTDSTVIITDGTTNIVKSTCSTASSTGILFEGTGNVAISGGTANTGTLSVYSGNASASSEVESIAIKFKSQATSTLTISGNVTAIAGTAETTGSYYYANSIGIYYEVSSLSITNGNIVAKGGNVTATSTSAATTAGLSGAKVTITGDTLTAESGTASGGESNTSYAVLGNFVATNSSIKAGADNSGTDTLYNGQKWLYVSFGPSITVGAQTGTLTYGAADSATYTLTASNFDAFNPTIEWITATHDGVTISVNGTTVTATITATTNAGTYKFKVKSGDTLSEEVTLTVGKATYGGQKTVNSTMPALGKVNATVWVPAASSGGAFGTPVASGTIILTDISIGTTTLKFTAPVSTVGQTGIITIPVTGCTNYEDYEIVVTLTSTNKTTVTIDGLSGENKDFTGSGISGVSGTATFTGGYTGELTYTYYSGSTATGTALTSAPTNAGTYTVRVAIPENDEEYTGYADYTFTITKAKLTVPTSKEVKATGSEQTVALNGFDNATMTITGNVGTDAGEYTATVSIKDTANYEWADGSITAKTVSWTIIKTGLSGGAIAGIVIGSILLLLAAAYTCGYFFLYKKGKLDGKAIVVIYKFLKK